MSFIKTGDIKTSEPKIGGFVKIGDAQPITTIVVEAENNEETKKALNDLKNKIAKEDKEAK